MNMISTSVVEIILTLIDAPRWLGITPSLRTLAPPVNPRYDRAYAPSLGAVHPAV